MKKFKKYYIPVPALKRFGHWMLDEHQGCSGGDLEPALDCNGLDCGECIYSNQHCRERRAYYLSKWPLTATCEQEALVLRFLAEATKLCYGATLSKDELWEAFHKQDDHGVSKAAFISCINDMVDICYGKTYRSQDIRRGGRNIKGFRGIQIKTPHLLPKLTEEAFQDLSCPDEAYVLMTLPDHHVLALDKFGKPIAVLELKCYKGTVYRDSKTAQSYRDAIAFLNRLK